MKKLANLLIHVLVGGAFVLALAGMAAAKSRDAEQYDGRWAHLWFEGECWGVHCLCVDENPNCTPCFEPVIVLSQEGLDPEGSWVFLDAETGEPLASSTQTQ